MAGKKNTSPQSSGRFTKGASFILLFLLFVHVFFDDHATEFYQTMTATTAVKARTRTTTPGEPRPQVVFLVNYHKTGHDVTNQYLEAVNGAVSPRHIKKTTPEKVLATTFLSYKKRNYESQGEFFRRRDNNYKNGCPKTNDPPKNLLTDAQLSRPTSATATKPTRIIVTKLQGPSLFCNLDEHDVFLQEKFKHVSSTYPNHDVKFVHMIRDIFSMALSNYLYHSQKPTPEPDIKHWMLDCNPKAWMQNNGIDRVVHSDETNEFGIERSLITTDQIDRIVALCEELVVDPRTGKPFEHYYQALRRLPRYDGLRLALCEFLILKRSDLLRMTHNVLRLREWQQQQQEQTEQSNNNRRERAVLTLKTDQDWSGENYAHTLNRVTNFVLDDLEVWGDNHRNQKNAEAELEREKEQMVAGLQKRALKLRDREYKKKSSHFTKGKSNDRSELMEKLQRDELFAPILSNLQDIIDSVVLEEQS
jgi:hypothetical protein